MMEAPRPCACGRPGCVLVRRDNEAPSDWARRKYANYACRNRGMTKEPAGKGRRRDRMVARKRSLLPTPPREWVRHPATAPLTAEQREWLEPYIASRATTANLADRTGLPPAAIAAYRLERARNNRQERERAERSGDHPIAGGNIAASASKQDRRFRRALARSGLRRLQDVDQITLWREWIGRAA